MIELILYDLIATDFGISYISATVQRNTEGLFFLVVKQILSIFSPSYMNIVVS